MGCRIQFQRWLPNENNGFGLGNVCNLKLYKCGRKRFSRGLLAISHHVCMGEWHLCSSPMHPTTRKCQVNGDRQDGEERLGLKARPSWTELFRFDFSWPMKALLMRVSVLFCRACIYADVARDCLVWFPVRVIFSFASWKILLLLSIWTRLDILRRCGYTYMWLFSCDVPEACRRTSQL